MLLRLFEGVSPMKFTTLSLPLIAALALASPALASETPAVAPGDTLLTISAEGKSSRIPDIANYSAGITTIGQTASAAMAANAAAMTRVIAALKQAGIADRDIQTANLSLNPVYENTDRNLNPNAPRITGYQATNTVVVRARALGAMGQVIDTLVSAGANEVSGPNFGLDHPEAALDEARIAAMSLARSRADLYARAAGLKVLRILSIGESGGYSPQPMMAMARVAKANAPTPVEAGEVSMNINLTVQFELAPQ
jgi:uncharacterized protein YggE